MIPTYGSILSCAGTKDEKNDKIGLILSQCVITSSCLVSFVFCFKVMDCLVRC